MLNSIVAHMLIIYLCACSTKINGDYTNAVSAAQLVVERLKEAPRRPRAQASQRATLGMASTMLVPNSMSSAIYGVQTVPQVNQTK